MRRASLSLSLARALSLSRARSLTSPHSCIMCVYVCVCVCVLSKSLSLSLSLSLTHPHTHEHTHTHLASQESWTIGPELLELNEKIADLKAKGDIPALKEAEVDICARALPSCSFPRACIMQIQLLLCPSLFLSV
jgi:hypothetical protein